jgi:apolipoprotein N-acyltransferase
MGQKRGTGFFEAAAVVTSATAYFFGTGLNGFAPLVWIAPVPILLLAFRSSARRSAALAFLAYALGALNIVSYVLRVAPPVAAVAAVVLPALAFALAVLAQRYVVQRWKHWVCTLVFPAAWTSYEFLLSLGSPDGTALNLAYSQADVLPLLQLAALTGIWGISFVITLLPSGLAVAWFWRAERRPATYAAMVPIVAVLFTLGYGWLRLVRPEHGDSLQVAAAATDETVDLFDDSTRDRALPVLRQYTRRIEELARRGARLVVLPEKFVGVAPAYEEEALAILRESSRKNQLTVIAGLNRIGRAPAYNTAFVLGPTGELVFAYDKAFLVPGLEREYQRGATPGIFQVGEATAGVAICKDMDFPKWLRRYAARGAQIVFVPAWDFVDDGPLHARMAIVRGVEGGFAVVRSAQQGLVTVSDHRGRIMARQVTSERRDVLVATGVALGPGRTLYSRTGDWFGFANPMIVAILIITAARRARRMPSAVPDSPKTVKVS